MFLKSPADVWFVRIPMCIGMLVLSSTTYAEDERLGIMRATLCSLADTRDPVKTWNALDASKWLGVSTTPKVRNSSKGDCIYVAQSRSMDVGLELGICSKGDLRSITFIYSSDPEDPETLFPFDDESEVEHWLNQSGANKITRGSLGIEGEIADTREYYSYVAVDFDMGEVSVEVDAYNGHSLNSQVIGRVMTGICNR